MSKKAKGPDMKRVLIDEGNSVSPFSGIVLKEKKEPEKKKPMEKPVPKKPNEIVQGYVPSASFADILESFEKTGNPYRMPDRKASAPKAKTSFADILDQWEGKTPGKKKATKAAVEQPKQVYKATRSFADILNQFDGQTAEKQKKAKPEAPQKKPEVVFHGTSFYLEETEDEKVPQNVSWSVIGGKNNSYVKPAEPKKEEVEEKKDKYVRSTPKYQPQKSFADILGTYDDNGKKKRLEEERKTRELLEKQKQEARRKKPELTEEQVEEHSFLLKEDEENKVPSNVSWSVIGGKNNSYVKPVEPPKPVLKEEPKAEEKKTQKPKQQSRQPKAAYKPQKSFDSILMDYEKEKRKEKAKNPAPVKEIKKEEPQVKEPNFFLPEDEGNQVPQNVSWSIIGGRNESFVRPKVEEKPKEEPKLQYERVSAPYVPEKKFSSILKDYAKDKELKRRQGDENAREKTFEEIMKEKGDHSKKKPRYTINELRRMDPQSTLDLHGETQAESEKQIKDFLEEAKANGLRKVSIITGKGLHSEDGQGVLKALTDRILEESGMVSENSSAPLNKGGSGATWIILKEDKE